jgi:hypothetical protein
VYIHLNEMDFGDGVFKYNLRKESSLDDDAELNTE